MDDPDPDESVASTFDQLIGTWSGRGTGGYPTMGAFEFEEEVTFGRLDEISLRYEQRATAADAGLLHTEVGIWRLRPGGTLEVTIAFASVTEVSEGSIYGNRIGLASTAIGRARLGADLRSTRRTYVLVGDTLTYDVEMAARDVPLTWHIQATLQRGT